MTRARALFLSCVLGLGGAVACASAPPPKPPPAAETSASEEPDDPDAAAAAWAHEVLDGGLLAEGGGLLIASGASLMKGDEEEARQLLAQFVAPDADHVALTRSLRPSTNDYKALFDAATAPKIESGQSKDWASGKAAIRPGQGQTEVKIASATGADLAAWTGNAKEFPAGYKKLGKHIAPNATFYRFKFVEPGKDTGTAYDGLAFVNGHWVIAPKPFRALEGKGAGLDEEPAAEEPAKPAGKKPKGKKKKK
ncbi:MAG: hypothetical protein KIT84_03395 [Labilithrix sp.]|nr:hypothetical protein [Labilithrix sp.]MCW5810028.1 hypothetical protein [Labilithrix sp.]